ncbi:hypothetical protein FF099_09100 [Aquisalinus flavus]|nr:hypothetical protein FF099_09100 [Aquisalinus flavus]
MLDPVIVHLSKDSDLPEVEPRMKEADLILAQSVNDNYPCQFVRTQNLREAHGDKVVIWINLFYTFYNPELRYVRRRGQPTLSGPMGDYHIETVLHGFQNGHSVQEVVSLLGDEAWNADRYKGRAEASLDELKRRDELTDLRICDFIEESQYDLKLFHTFNHPAKSLLREYARRALDHIGKPPSRDPELDKMGEPLGKFLCPINPMAARKVRFDTSADTGYRGVKFTIEDGRVVNQRDFKFYSPLELVEAYYRVYEAVDLSDIN